MEWAGIEVSSHFIQGWLLAGIGLEKFNGRADSLVVRTHGKSIAELGLFIDPNLALMEIFLLSGS